MNKSTPSAGAATKVIKGTKPKIHLTPAAHHLIEQRSSYIRFSGEDRLGGGSKAIRLRQFYDDCDCRSRVFEETIQFVSGCCPSHFFLSLTNPKGEVIPSTEWNPSLTRPRHFFNGPAATFIQEFMWASPREKLPAAPDKPDLELYRYRHPNGRWFAEVFQFEHEENYFLTLQPPDGQLFEAWLWEREQLHQDHQLAPAGMILICGASWKEESTERGAHLCSYLLPDGRRYREFLQGVAGTSNNRAIYFLALHQIGEEGQTLHAVQESRLNSI